MEQSPIYSGFRDNTFKYLIQGLLKKGNIKEKYIDIITNEENMKIYSQAFTSETADPVNNYENFEQLGDVTAGAFIVWYMYQRFPQLFCNEGKAIVARLKINYGAKQSFAKIADKLGFWKFITASVEEREHNKKKLMEDCFEAFIGCTEYLINKISRVGVGYGLVYDMLSNIFNDIDISLKYEDIIDAKSRLKEILDVRNFKSELRNLKYTDSRDEELRLAKSVITLEIKGRVTTIGSGTAAIKIDAQQKASEQAIESLKKLGYIKSIPEKYNFFCG